MLVPCDRKNKGHVLCLQEKAIFCLLLLSLCSTTVLVSGQSGITLIDKRNITLTAEQEKNLATCQNLLSEAMATDGEYEAIKNVLYKQYVDVNPGPFVVCKDIETTANKTFISFHPFNPLQRVPKEDWPENLLARGETPEEILDFLENHTEMEEAAVNSPGEYLFGDLPATESAAPSSLTLEAKDRYFLFVGGKNTSWTGPGDDYFVCHCPFTDLPSSPRNNTNVVGDTSDATSLSRSMGDVMGRIGLLMVLVILYA